MKLKEKKRRITVLEWKYREELKKGKTKHKQKLRGEGKARNMMKKLD